MKTFATSLALLASILTPLAAANQEFYIGYCNDNKITWKEGQDTCMAEFQTLVGKTPGGESQNSASACGIAFQAKDTNGNGVKLTYTKCGDSFEPSPPEVWEVDRVTGAPVRQVGSCVNGYKDTGKRVNHECGFFDKNIWDANTGHVSVIQWTCEIAI